jgi:hypothetical protein
MALDVNIKGTSTGTAAFAGAGSDLLKVITGTNAAGAPGDIGATRAFQELDSGSVTGTALLYSVEVDNDYRARIAQDTMLDEELFNYTAQNTGKHQSVSTTMAATWTAGQFTTNSGAITTTTTGYYLQTYANFPNIGANTLSGDFEVSFSAQPSANNFVEFGFVPNITSATVTPGDGIFFRLNSAGLQGIVSNNSAETSTGVFPLAGGAGTWAYTNSKRYQFIVYTNAVSANFWVNDGTGAVLLGSINLPTGTGRVAMGAGMKAFFGQRITGGAAGAALSANLNAYSVRVGGMNADSTLTQTGNRLYGAYQGLGGGTQGSLATYVNSTNPTAAAPSNTALTANLPGGLGGQGAVIAAAAAATDGIWGSYQVPVPTVNVPGRRLVITGLRLSAVNLGAAVATTATTIQFSLAFGHTAVSLATGEATNTKAPRRISIGFMTWAIGAAIGQGPQNGDIVLDLSSAPIYVNPGEFVQLVGKFMAGTATASQVINFTWQPIYGWE